MKKFFLDHHHEIDVFSSLMISRMFTIHSRINRRNSLVSPPFGGSTTLFNLSFLGNSFPV